MYSYLTEIDANHHRQQLIDEAASYRHAGAARTAAARGKHRPASPFGTRLARVFLGH
jgi:hypothetical protein